MEAASWPPPSRWDPARRKLDFEGSSRRVQKLGRVGDCEAQGLKRIRAHRPHRLRTLPARLSTAHAKLAQAGGLEEAQLVRGELARLARAAALVAELDAEALRLDRALTYTNAHRANREAEDGSAHPE